ncbi:MAG: hypothetical protein HZB44_08595 [Actinobacteria bacterium]|nr:hypothetical protein [Actinomycetota bacterium]
MIESDPGAISIHQVAREKIMKIICYLSPGCGSEDELRTNIGLALEAEKKGHAVSS